MDRKILGVIIVALGLYLAWADADIGGWLVEAFKFPGGYDAINSGYHHR